MDRVLRGPSADLRKRPRFEGFWSFLRGNAMVHPLLRNFVGSHADGMENSLRCFRRVTIVDPTPMFTRASLLARAAVIAGLLVGLAQPAFADARATAKSQVDFGIKVAQNGLWKEATYRWEKAVEIDPTYAAAWNNLGIGYEHEGRVRGGPQGVRESGRSRSQEHSDSSELRSLQRNQ